ncbi:LysR substrate-binding domain-containing protein [Pseudalkalibacillus sp. A8]|uniref:LysR substrate-binding domain-containing protein n=1 Tax=Pseudalkalibacillus sp. A8 TaxID=3382641 RepID=UPI0038B45726
MNSYPGLCQTPFLEDELVIITSNEPSNPIGQQKQITPDELLTLPVIMREPGSGTRQVIEEHLRAHQLDLKDLNIILERKH